VNNNKIQGLRCIALVPLFFVLFFSIKKAFAGSGEITPLVLKGCSQATCYEVITQKGLSARSVPLIYFLGKVELRVFKSKSRETILRQSGQSGYFDPISNIIVIRNIKGHAFNEILFQIERGVVTKF